MFAAYAIARLIDQAMPGGGWFSRAAAVVALLAVLFGALLLIALEGMLALGWFWALLTSARR